MGELGEHVQIAGNYATEETYLEIINNKKTIKTH